MWASWSGYDLRVSRFDRKTYRYGAHRIVVLLSDPKTRDGQTRKNDYKAFGSKGLYSLMKALGGKGMWVKNTQLGGSNSLEKFGNYPALGLRILRVKRAHALELLAVGKGSSHKLS